MNPTDNSLLATIRDRIRRLDKPAYVKNSGLVYVCVNNAYARLFGLDADEMAGRTTADLISTVERLDLEDRERRAIVFGEDQIAGYADPFGAGRFQVEIERFSADDGQFFLFAVFEPLAGPHIQPATSEDAAFAVSETGEDQPVIDPGVPGTGLTASDIDDLLGAIDAGVMIYDRDDKIRYVNDKGGLLYEHLVGKFEIGMSRRDIAGRIYDSRVFDDPSHEQMDRETWVNNRLKGHDAARSTRIDRMTDGRWVKTVSRRLADGGLISIRVDVSDLKERERHLEETIRDIGLYRSLLDNLPVAAFVRGSDHRIVYANQRYAALCGMDVDALTGTDETDLFGEDGTALRAANDKTLEDGEDVMVEQDLVVPSGDRIQVLTNIKRMQTDDGARYLIGSLTDISRIKLLDGEVAHARRSAERAFHLAEDATNTMPQGLVIIDDDRIVLSNVQVAGLLGLDAALFAVGAPWVPLYQATVHASGIIDPAEIDASTTRFRAALADKAELDYNFPLDGGRWMRLQGRPSRNGEMVLLFTDLTEVIHREAELRSLLLRAEAADRAKSEFLANMSHEIRTPMNGILGMAELLSRTRLDTRQKTFVDIVMKSGNALMAIINDILDFSRLDAGEMTLRAQPFDPGEAVEDIASLLNSRATEKGIELAVRILPGVPETVTGDAGRFRQIVTNLVGNAVKFTERGHVLVTIGAAVDPSGRDCLDLVVEDTGPGISEDKVSGIFDKFVQTDGSASRRHDGSGLGLAITQGLVSLHDGTISVDSSPGRGSRFSVRLPMPFANPRPRARPLPVNVGGARILVVDDNSVNRSILTAQLADWQFDAVAVETGEEALEVLEAAHDSGVRVDVVVLDDHMPGQSGLDVANRIRADRRFDDTAVVFLTSMESAADEDLFHDLHVDAHLMKPARAGLLRDTLVDVVRARRVGVSADGASPPVAETFSASPAPVTAEERPQLALVTDGGQPPPNSFPAIDVDIGGFMQLLESQPSLEDIGRPTGLDVLIAEDNEVNQIVFRQILDGTGISFRIVDNGEKAVAAWQDDNPAIILMDTMMPVMDGLAACRAIRAMEAATGGRVPIIGVTARALDSDRDACLRAGMDDHLAKPISPDRLEAKIRLWMDQRRDRRQNR